MTGTRQHPSGEFPSDVDVAIVAHNNRAVLPATLCKDQPRDVIQQLGVSRNEDESILRMVV